MGIDDDRQIGDTCGPSDRSAHVRTRLFPGARRLPEHSVTAAGFGEYDLGPVLSSPIEHHVDHGAAAHTGTQRHLLDDLGGAGPLIGRNRIAEQRFGARPGVGSAKHHPARKRESQQKRQPGGRVGVAGNQHVHGATRPPTRRFISSSIRYSVCTDNLSRQPVAAGTLFQRLAQLPTTAIAAAGGWRVRE